VSVPNTDRVVESIIQANNYLRGHEAFKILMYASNLPDGVTAGHIGSDPDRHSNIKEKLYIDTCSSNQESVTFVLKSKLNIKGIVVPRRSYSRECHWALSDKFKGTECDPTTSVAATYTDCDGSLNDCRIRNNVERFGGFPSIPKKGLTIL